MKLPFWATIFTITGVIILCGLGMWQIKRLAWKNNLLDRIRAEYRVDSAAVDLDPSIDLSEKLFKRGFLKGEFVHEKAILIEARTYKGNPGYHMITPFKMMDYKDKIVFVNRGWVPMGFEVMSEYIKKPQGLVMITGALRPSPESNGFVPKNIIDQDQWYQIKPEEIAKAKGFNDFYSNIFYKEVRGKKRGVPDLPIPQDTKININNNHAAYALFWFIMAMAMVIIYGLRFIAPQFRKQFK